MLRRFGFIALMVVGALVMSVALFQPKSISAETPAPIQRTLDVTGQGKLTVKYDTAEITLGFSEVHETATGAYSAMGGAMDKVSNAVKAKGVKEDDIRTGALNLTQEWDWTKEGGRVLKGYRATNTIVITTQKLESAAELIQTAVESGANEIQGVRFTIKNTDALMNQALDLAVADAKAKAERVAGKLDAKIVGVYKVSVMDGGRSPIVYDAPMAMEAKAMAVSVPVFGGTGEYSAMVSVTFEIQ
ncbi:MAG TPA: SIMPL domain-containing protein [Symbiobacteriaceae bacterium]|nr:SIMPL domain-containing protein [Symbiobacteriaceae bacterium]